MSLVVDLNRRLETYAQQLCLAGDGFAHSFATMLGVTRTWDSRLRAMAINTGTVVGLIADYSLDGISALLALCNLGAIVALIPRDRPVNSYLEDSNSEVLLQLYADGRYDHTRIRAKQAAHPLLQTLRATRQAVLIIFTSGSSGWPKAALHSLDRFLSKFHRPGRSFRTLAFMVFDHVAGLDTLFYTLSNGGALIVPARRDPQTVLETTASQQVQVLPASPSFLRLLCVLDGDHQLDLSSLEVITYGSEPMDQPTLDRLNERFPHAQVIQKYGTTEVGSPRTVSRGKDSLWLRIKDTEAKIVNGILWLRSEGTMLGYLNAPSPLDSYGWYCTGDLVEVEGEWMRFLGRADETIKVGGEKVSPVEVERVIRELDFIRDVVISGEPHPLLGQIVRAHVQLKPGVVETNAIATQIRTHCSRCLSSHHVPVRIEFSSEISTSIGYRQKSQRRNVSSETASINREPLG